MFREIVEECEAEPKVGEIFSDWQGVKETVLRVEPLDAVNWSDQEKYEFYRVTVLEEDSNDDENESEEYTHYIAVPRPEPEAEEEE